MDKALNIIIHVGYVVFKVGWLWMIEKDHS